MDFRILVVSGGGTGPTQEVRFRSDDGRAHGSVHFTDPEVFTKAVQGDTLSLDIDVSGYEEAPQTTGAGATVTTTEGQPVATDTASVAVAQPAATTETATTRKSRTPQ